MNIPNDVMRDFKCAIEGQFNIKDFTLNYKDTSSPPHPQTGEYFDWGIISITKNSSHKEREYKTGHGTNWPLDFKNDLDSGYFEK
ncbi:hypothetical protein Lnau_3129 [Legionella nautarum]|uniref:Uncharacterized protein n=1 Tax=Legionella nautarum TaxID=45070 RepID=A0A0W0WIQ8_9GAMM|nr:hypothetical protein [Legionella nautarum]KTD32218.1 hypothetical protein Lnau_3129 [Legionella nautarum]